MDTLRGAAKKYHHYKRDGKSQITPLAWLHGWLLFVAMRFVRDDTN
jgi:hypothetical protein